MLKVGHLFRQVSAVWAFGVLGRIEFSPGIFKESGTFKIFESGIFRVGYRVHVSSGQVSTGVTGGRYRLFWWSYKHEHRIIVDTFEPRNQWILGSSIFWVRCGPFTRDRNTFFGLKRNTKK